MRSRRDLVVWLAAVAMTASVGAAHAEELTIRGTIAPAAWQAFEARFVDQSGRVIDDANGGISHSEGQGYGLILALAADDRASFERIWSFTQTELLLRDDGLAAWRWTPAAPHVPDINNATDGDLLIAYGLAKAGDAWSVPGYTEAATKIATSIGGETLDSYKGQLWLLPGAHGFSAKDRADGPIVNLSYWLFEALPVMARLAPEFDWGAVWTSGLKLSEAARFGTAGLPSDWLSVHDPAPVPAAQFTPDFGYNAIRIPLYLMRAGFSDPRWLAPYSQAWHGGAQTGIPLINVKTDQIVARLAEPGYRMLAATLDCVTEKTPLPEDLKLFRPTHYYPSALYLLSLSFLTERHAECL